MKATTDLLTAIVVAIIGAVISFFVCNIFLSDIKEESFKTVSGEINTSITELDNEIFNVDALNPTVEVYIGTQKEGE